jgi:hypothetical protein
MTSRTSSMTPASPDRRRVLRGIGGATLGLPLLDLFRARSARAAVDKVYSVFVIGSNGVQQADQAIVAASDNRRIVPEPERFWPSALGPFSTASLAADSARTVSELKEYADKLLIVAGIKYNYGSGGCGHAGGCAQALTARQHMPLVAGNGGTTAALGESVDNRIARELHPTIEPLTLYAGTKHRGGHAVFSYRASKVHRSTQDNPLVEYQNLVGLGARRDGSRSTTWSAPRCSSSSGATISAPRTGGGWTCTSPASVRSR